MQKHFGCFAEETETKQALLYFLGSRAACISAISILYVLSHIFCVWVLKLEKVIEKNNEDTILETFFHFEATLSSSQGTG